VAKVDIEENDLASVRFNIEEMPTILFLKEGKVYTFEGNRTEKDLFEFVTTGYSQLNSTDIPKIVEKRNDTDKDDDDDEDEKDGFVWPADPDTTVLNSTNFENETASGSWLIDFYANWCPHVKKIFYYFNFFFISYFSSVANSHQFGPLSQQELKQSLKEK
jgi:thioredoxin domain-containing protein 5